MQTASLAEVQRLLQAKDLPSADRMLAALTSCEPAPRAAYRLRAQVLIQLGQFEEALKITRKGLAEWPGDEKLDVAFVEILQRSLTLEEAHGELLKAAENSEDAFLESEVALSWLALGKPGLAVRHIRRAVGLGGANEKVTLRRIFVLAAAGKADRASRLLTKEGPPAAALMAMFTEAVQRLARLGSTGQAIAIAKNATALSLDGSSLLVCCAEALLRERRPADALACLDEMPPSLESMQPDVAFRYFRARGQALRDSARRDEAFSAFEQAAKFNAEDEAVLHELYVLAQRLGKEEKRRSYGMQLARTGSKSLPPTLAEGLALLRGQDLSLRHSARLAWAWELADKSKWQEDAWLAGVAWGQAADRLLRAWWLKAHDRCDEIDALIDRPANSLFDTLSPKTKCLCVTTHMGPLAASVRYIQTVGRPFRGYGVAGPDPVIGDAPPMRIAKTGGARALRQVITEMSNGTLIGLAPETPDAKEPLAVEFLGRKITLSTLAPRLVWNQGAACIWWHALWRDGRIVIEAERLPDPERDEPEAEWCRRWIAAYLDRVACMMRGSPENLNLRGIWSNAD